MSKQWYEYPDVVLAVAEWAEEQGEFITRGDVLRYFERPVKFSDWFVLWEVYQDERCAPQYLSPEIAS